jgi:ribonuclease BN (tRNA processing enzyme)
MGILLRMVFVMALAGLLHPLRAADEAPRRTRVVMLGTGTPNADPERSGPAVAVVVDSTAYLIDCGPGLVRRAAGAHRNGVKGLDAKHLGYLFVTHLHSDHTAGYPDLILMPWVLERSTPLEAFGPPGLQAMTEHLLKAYDADIRNRLDGLQPANPDGYKVTVHEIAAEGVVFQDERVRVTAFRVDHGTWADAFGYRFDTPDRSIVISGDCVPSPGLIRHARGADILIHEVFSTEGFKQRPPEWQRYHAKSHTSTAQLAEIAAQARPGLLVLYHQLFWGVTDEDLIDEIRAAGYDGAVVSAKDLEVY